LSDCFDVEQTFDNHKIINLLKLLFTTARNCAALNNIINKDTAVKSQANRLKMSLKKKKKIEGLHLVLLAKVEVIRAFYSSVSSVLAVRQLATLGLTYSLNLNCGFTLSVINRFALLHCSVSQ
jgi:hypothetical protein